MAMDIHPRSYPKSIPKLPPLQITKFGITGAKFGITIWPILAIRSELSSAFSLRLSQTLYLV